jgi:hypothetical protein
VSYPYNIHGKDNDNDNNNNNNNESVANHPQTYTRPHLVWTLLVMALWWLVLSFQSFITNTHTSDFAIYIRAVAEGLATMLAWAAAWVAIELLLKQTPSWRLHALVGAGLLLANQLGTGLALSWLLYALNWVYISWWPTAIEAVLCTLATIATARFVLRTRGKRYQLVVAPLVVLCVMGLYSMADQFEVDLPPRVVSNVFPAGVWVVTEAAELLNVIDSLCSGTEKGLICTNR